VIAFEAFKDELRDMEMLDLINFLSIDTADLVERFEDILEDRYYDENESDFEEEDFYE